ncbi:hypothetical protein DSL72_009061 [Monilinia vaccinii-corymbosi]|uniref:RING-type domain-containing protein n=1 Tax=Monilinia vaccinii-corymbosi TaxID=61207 RepID=A0A8A3PPY4_9HELO|nr:hypothetical protein DSL72_009061 [Monilinia vaccinii-corymbosi]
MTSGYPYSHSPRHNNRHSNTASTSNSNNRSPWGNDSLSGIGRDRDRGRGRGRGSEESESLTLPPISQAPNSRNSLELPGLSSSPLFVPETHTRQVQPELPSYGSGSTSTSTSTSNTNINSTAASAFTFATIANPEPGRIKHPRSASPPDLFSFDPYDESSRYRSPPPLPPPSDQVAQQTSQQAARGSSFYDEDAQDLLDFDLDALLARNNDDIADPFASPPQIPSRGSDTSAAVDLTDTSSAMAPPLERRRALSGTSLRPATLTRPKSPKRKKSIASPSTKPSKRRKLSAPKINADEDVEVVDLAENSNLQEYEAAQAKERENLIKQQNQDEATKPIKLVDFQCIICMDNPTDLTVTHCGHLFCSECLHSALHAGNNGRKTCPVCRTAVSTTSIPGRKPPRNGTFPISIKLMTANKMGKKPTKA